MDSWVTLLVGAITATAALGGTWLSNHHQHETQMEHLSAVHEQAKWEDKRDAFLDFLSCIDECDSNTTGRMLGESSQLPTPEEAAPLLSARARVEFYSSGETWASAERLATAIALRANLNASRVIPQLQARRSEIEAQLKELDAFEPEGIDRLRVAYISASRAELNI